MTRHIEWTDKRGWLHIFVNEPLSFGPIRDPRHEFQEEIRYYLRDGGGEIRGLCWCQEKADHWYHTAPGDVP